MPWGNYITVIIFEVIFLFFTLWISLKKYRSKFDLYISLAVFLFYTMFIFFCANWYSINYYLRFLNVIIISAVIVKALLKIRGIPIFYKREAGYWLLTFLKICCLILFIYYNYIIANAFVYQGKPAELSFPLKNGIYCITDGGNGKSGLLMNSHPLIHSDKKDWSETLKYSVDIVKINYFGFSSNGIFPNKNEKYEIFGDSIYSPCDGEIVYAINNFPDNEPFSKFQSGANYLLIRYKKDIYVSLCHLKSGSLQVNEGDHVRKGQYLAKVGNSGGTPMPHLHIDVMLLKDPWINSMKVDYDGSWYIVGEPVPFVFDGRFPVRNSLFLREK